MSFVLFQPCIAKADIPQASDHITIGDKTYYLDTDIYNKYGVAIYNKDQNGNYIDLNTELNDVIAQYGLPAQDYKDNQYRYLGFTVDGYPYTNIAYPNDKDITNPSEVSTWNFIKTPWYTPYNGHNIAPEPSDTTMQTLYLQEELWLEGVWAQIADNLKNDRTRCRILNISP
jgi:hypothetical protein